MYLRKSFVQYLPIVLVFGLVIASFIDYNINYCLTLYLEGHKIQVIIYTIIYNIFLVFFVWSYCMVTFTDPGTPTKDVINVLSGAELESYYTIIDEIPELKKMTESTSTNSSQHSTGALLNNEEKIEYYDNNIGVNIDIPDSNNNEKHISSSTLITNNKIDGNNNCLIDIPLTELPSTSNINGKFEVSTETLINNSQIKEQNSSSNNVVTFDSLLIEKPNIGNVVVNRSVNKKDQISIDIDNDRIIERNINKFNDQINLNETSESKEDNQSVNNRRNNENEEEINNLVCKKCLRFKPERTHHCSVCKRCVLKMDHHCPWLSNCVGFYNYKYFILFLLYGSIYILFQFITIFISFVSVFPFSDRPFDDIIFLPDNKKLWIIHILMTFVLGFSICLFLVSHIYQNLLKNATTLELFDKQRRIRKYRFKIIRDNSKREIDKLEDEVKELEEFIENSPSAPNINIKTNELKLKKRKLKSKLDEYNSPRNRSPNFISDSTRNVPKSILHNPYDVGNLNNFYQVFGKNPKLWLLPVQTTMGDGYHYPKHEYLG